MVGDKCRVNNPLTGSCSCPSDGDIELIKIQHSQPLANQPVTYSAFAELRGEAATTEGSLVICARRPSPADRVNFGGAFTSLTDGSCHQANPFTDACSCPKGNQENLHLPLNYCHCYLIYHRSLLSLAFVGSHATTSTMVGAKGESMVLSMCGPVITRDTNAQICDGTISCHLLYSIYSDSTFVLTQVYQQIAQVRPMQLQQLINVSYTNVRYDYHLVFI
jgi:hypothetical protein